MKNMKKLFLLWMFALVSVASWATVPPLHVDGRYFKDDAGRIVNLHGFAQTFSPWFNERGTKWNNYDVDGCLSYNKGIIDRILATGWKMDFVRQHMDPYWSNNPTKASEWESQHGGYYPENEIYAFEMTRFKTYLEKVFVPMAEYAISKGLYVVMRPPGVCPDVIRTGDAYQQYLISVWDVVSRNAVLKNNPGILFELANEPISIVDANGKKAGTDEMARYIQPVVDIIRQNGCDNILLIPGLGWQAQYAGFAATPVTGGNIGYAVHCYPGWYNGNHGDNNVEINYADFKKGWEEQITPCSNFAPIVVTEMDWAPAKYDASWGKAYTGTAGGNGFGANFKRLADESGNVSWLLFTEGHHLAAFKDQAPSNGQYTFLTDPEACPWACYHWYQDYAKQRQNGVVPQVTSVNLARTSITMTPGSILSMPLTATTADGLVLDVAGDAEYTVSNPAVLMMNGGTLVGRSEGETDIEVRYTDPQGTLHTYQVHVIVSFFPLTADGFNPSIWETGTFNPSTGNLHTGQWGFGGWWYTNGIDLSSYRYIVARLNRTQSCGASFRLFDENNYWAGASENDFGSRTELVLDLHNLTKTNGAKIDPSHLYIVGFWTNGSGDVSIKEVFVSDDGKTRATGIEPLLMTGETPPSVARGIYDLQGRRINSTVSLAPGLYIIDGRKTLVK